MMPAHLYAVKNRLWLVPLVVVVGLLGSIVVPSVASPIDDLNSKIEENKKEIQTLSQQIKAYQDKIAGKQRESLSLQNQLALLENEVAKVQLDITATQTRIEQNELEIQRTDLQIADTQQRASQARERIAAFIRLLNVNGGVTYLKVLLTQPSLSQFFDQVQYAKQIQEGLSNSLEELEQLKAQLREQRNLWQAKVAEEEQLKLKLDQQRAELEERLLGQAILLGQVRLSEREYRTSLSQLKAEQQQANADIVSLEKQVREELEKKDRDDFFSELGDAQLGWPVDPSRGITAFFHDKSYPFRNVFEHPAVDVRAPQGTQIRTAEAGYVARVKFAGDASYAYIMVVHNNGLSTVYGHISKPLIQEDEVVTKGQVIGLTGGLPGSVGSGKLTTGPHLHFEVRLDGIPVDPLKFLPAY